MGGRHGSTSHWWSENVPLKLWQTAAACDPNVDDRNGHQHWERRFVLELEWECGLCLWDFGGLGIKLLD